ncbi:response regulator transcription factor [Dyadobacter crusticola]|uniref:response regulator transcription factor n=1 Tax=Dyadobacter crusticola TaxID=292407 RepID=UPI0004E0CF6F|nr:response regulator transcription factor [Dyadobacter crusticola]
MIDKVEILIFEDHPVTARGLKAFLEKSLSTDKPATAEIWYPGQKPARQAPADIFILSVNPRSAFPGIFDKLQKEYFIDPKQLVVFCDSSEFRTGLEYLYKGAAGFVFKETNLLELVRCVETVSSGQPYICQEAVQKILWHFMPGSDITLNLKSEEFPLTAKEFEIARELSRGLRVTEIARRFNITPGRVSICKSSIFRKLNIKDHRELSARLFELSANRKVV